MSDHTLSSLETLAGRVAAHFGFTFADLHGLRRTERLVNARAVFCVLASRHAYRHQDIAAILDRGEQHVRDLIRRKPRIPKVLEGAQAPVIPGKASASQHPFKADAKVVTIEVSSEIEALAAGEAARRGMCVHEMLSAVVAVVVEDRLIAAVLDR